MSADAKQPRPPIAFAAQLRIGLAPHQQNVRCRSNRLSVVNHRRPAIQPNNSREWRLDTRNAALAFKRLHQRRLFANLIRTRTRLRDDVEVQPRPKNILTEEALRVSIRNSLLHNLQQIPVFAAQIDKAKLRPNRKSRDHRAFNDGVRIFEEDHVILAGAWLGLVAVHQNILRLLRRLRDKRPLHPRGETRATASAQTRGLHRVNDPVRHLRALRDRLLHGLIPVEFDIFVDVGSALAEPPGEHSNFVRMRDQGRHYFSSFPLPSRYIWNSASTFAGVRFSWKS